MKTPEEIKLVHSYYKEIADLSLKMLRDKDRQLLTDGTWSREEISILNTRFRERQRALEFVMPELRQKE